MQAALQLALLGRFRACDAAGNKISIPGTKTALLLAYLALQPGIAHPRDKLIGLLWSDRAEAQARSSLRQALWALRRGLRHINPCPLIIEDGTIAIDPEAIETDVVVFETLLADGSPDALQSAVALYRGELLAGSRVRDPVFQEFLDSECRRLSTLAIDACVKLLDHQVKSGTDRAAVATARRLLELDPLQEAGHRVLMHHYAQGGHLGLAVKQYQVCRESLQRELGVSPDAKTERVYNAIRASRSTVAARGDERSATATEGSDHNPSRLDRSENRVASALEPADTHGADFARLSSRESTAKPDENIAVSDKESRKRGIALGAKCPSCRHENRPSQSFCAACGAPMLVVCLHCGALGAPDQEYCGGCGASVELAEPRPSSVSPNRYTPAHLAAKILTSRSVLEGERKQVTVLRAALNLPMASLDGRDPEDARLMLDPILNLMMKAVHRYEGTVNRMASDGIMALFGAPLAHEDHAVRASYAALAMRDAAVRAHEGAKGSLGVEPQIRIGLNSGEVVVRAIGNDLSMDYDAVGPTTQLAAHVETLAPAGAIYLTHHTLQLAQGLIRVKPSGDIEVEGLAQSPAVFELVGATPTRSRFQAAASRGLGPFIGRDADLEALGRALDRAKQGHGQVFAVVGEAGVGKSRLYYEFTHSPLTDGVLTLESRSVSYGKDTAYLPIIELLRTYFGVEEQDGEQRVRTKLTDRLRTLDHCLLPVLPALLTLLGVPAQDETWETLDPAHRRQRTLEAIKSLFLAESKIQPLVLVFENLHWIDGATQAVLDSLVETLPAVRILLLVNYRPEHRHSWGGRIYYSQRPIEPLPPEAAWQLLDALLGEHEALAPLKQMLIDWSEGNPFFVEESVRNLVETGSLQGDRGAFYLASPLEALQIPPTVQAVLAARIDRLSVENKQLLQMAAVVGKDVPVAILAAVSDHDEVKLQDCLATLQENELLYETRIFPNLEYTFKHALTHEVAYTSLLSEQRRAIHARVVQAIERLYPDKLVEHVESLAHHAVRGNLWEEAVSFLLECGTKAAMRSAYREAVAAFEQALVALHNLPRTRETLLQEIDSRFELRSSLQALGEHERVMEHLREAESLASKADDGERLGWSSAYLSQYLWRKGDAEQADAMAQRALTLADSSNDFALSAAAKFFRGQGHYNIGDYLSAIEYCGSNAQVLTGEQALKRFGLTGLPSVLSRIWLAWALAERGEFGSAEKHSQEAIAIAATADQPYSMAAAYLGIGQVQLIIGDIVESTLVLERAMELCKAWDLQVIESMNAALLGLSYALSDRIDEALLCLKEGEVQSSPIRIFETPMAVIARGVGYLLAGRSDLAGEIASHVAEVAIARGFRGNQAAALYLMGQTAMGRVPLQLSRADEHFRSALKLAEELGMRPLAAHCYAALGRLCHLHGEHRQRDQYLASALTIYRELDMPFWLDRVSATE